MRNLARYIFFAVIISALSLQSCNDNSADRNYAEQTAFRAFITGKNIAEDGFTESNGVCRVIDKNYYDAGDWERPDGYEGDFPPQVANGDEVSFFFVISEFAVNLKSATGTIGNLLYTNDKNVIDDINKKEGTGLNGYHPHLDSEYWPTDALTVKVGESGIMQGVMEALPGSRLGDQFWALIPSRLAYGDMKTGYFTHNTALYAIIVITDLNGINSR